MLTSVAPGVLVHESACVQSNSVVVQGRDGVLLVDAGITNQEMAGVAAALRERGQPVVAGFSTHPDADHVLWHADFGDAPRYGTAECAESIREVLSEPGWEAAVAGALPPEFADDVPLDQFGQLSGLPSGTTYVPWDGPQARIVEHRAHAPGHAALVIEEHRVLVAGDMLSDVLVPMLDWRDAGDPIQNYLAALELLERAAADVDVAIPGHGSVCGADQIRARIEQDRAYLHALSAGERPDDPRIGPAAKPGWEWVSDVHEGQAERFARRGEPDEIPG